MTTIDKDQRKIEMQLNAKLEANRKETQLLKADLNKARNIAAANSLEKVAFRLEEAKSQNSLLENEVSRLNARVVELTAAAENSELKFQVLQNVLERAVTQLAPHAKPHPLWSTA